MLRAFLATLLLLSIASLLPAADDPEIEKIVGTWKPLVQDPKWDEVWTFAHDNGKWQVSAVYLSKGEEVGSAKGTRVAYKNGVLTWTREFVKKPDPSLGSTPMSFQITKRGAELGSGVGKTKTIRALKRVDGPAAKGDPKGGPKTGGYAQVDEVQGSKTLVGLQMALSPDGMRVAMFNPKGTKSEVAIWDFKDKKVVQRLEGKGLGHRLAWSADGSTLVSSWFGESAKLGDPKGPDTITAWDTSDWKEKASFELPSTIDMAVSGDGKLLAVGSKALTSDKPGVVVFFDVTNKKEVRRLEAGGIGHDPRAVLSRDGKTAVINAHVKDTALSIVDTASGKVKQSFPKGRWPFALSNDGKTLVATHSASGVAKGKTFASEGVVVYDAANPKSGKEYLFENQGGVAIVGLLDKGQFAVLAGSLADVRILDTKTGKVVDRITPVKGLAVMNMRVSADSSRILVLGGDYKTRIYSTPFAPK